MTVGGTATLNAPGRPQRGDQDSVTTAAGAAAPAQRHAGPRCWLPLPLAGRASAPLAALALVVGALTVPVARAWGREVGDLISWITGYTTSHGVVDRTDATQLGSFLDGLRQEWATFDAAAPEGKETATAVLYEGMIGSDPAWKWAKGLSNTGDYYFISDTEIGTLLNNEKVEEKIKKAVGFKLDEKADRPAADAFIRRLYDGGPGISGAMGAPDAGGDPCGRRSQACRCAASVANTPTQCAWPGRFLRAGALEQMD